MSGMFNLGDIFQLVIDSFDYRSFAEQYPVIHRPDSTFHAAFKPGYQLYAVNKEFTEQVFADVSLVSDEFAIYELYERLYFQGSRSSTSPGVIMKFRISPLSLQIRCNLKP